MKRRTFLWLSAAGTASLYIPVSGCTGRYVLSNKSVAQPSFLTHICDAKTIRAIGSAYKRMVPAEKEDRDLARLILTDNSGHVISETTDNPTLENLLNGTVQHDFESGRTVVVDGWVLSQTEARQCALFSSQA